MTSRNGKVLPTLHFTKLRWLIYGATPSFQLEFVNGLLKENDIFYPSNCLFSNAAAAAAMGMISSYGVSGINRFAATSSPFWLPPDTSSGGANCFAVQVVRGYLAALTLQWVRGCRGGIYLRLFYGGLSQTSNCPRSWTLEGSRVPDEHSTPRHTPAHEANMGSERDLGSWFGDGAPLATPLK